MSDVLWLCLGVILGQLAYIAWLKRYQIRRLFRRRPKYTGPTITTAQLDDLLRSELVKPLVEQWVSGASPAQSFLKRDKP